MGTVGICHHFFDRSKSKLGEQITPNTKICPHLVRKCSARSGHLYVPPWLTWLALASVAASDLRVLKYSQPGQAKLPRPLSLPSPECGCRISQANCSRSLCQLNYMHFRVAGGVARVLAFSDSDLDKVCARSSTIQSRQQTKSCQIASLVLWLC